MRGYRVSVAAIIAGFSVCPAASADTLTRAVQQACAAHPRLMTAKLRIEESNFARDEALAVTLPRVNSTTEIGFGGDSDGFNSTTDNSRIMSTQLSLEQPLYIGGRGQATRNRATQSAQISRYQYDLTLSEVEYDAIRAYYSVKFSREEVEIREQSLVALQRQAQNARRRFELGVGTKTDILQAETRIERGKSTLIQAKSGLRKADAQYYQLMSSLPPAIFDETQLPRMPVNLQQANRLAETVNAEIAASREGILLARSNLEIVQGERSPDIRLIGSMAVQRDTAFNGFKRDDASLRVRMSIPIFAGGALSAREKQSRVAVKRSHYDRNEVYRQIYERVALAWSDWDTSLSSLESAQQLETAAEQAMAATQKEVDAGFRPALDLLNSEAELLEARLSVAQAEAGRSLSAYSVLRETGVLDQYGGFECGAGLPEYQPPSLLRLIPKPLTHEILGEKNTIVEAPKRPRRGPRGK